MDETFNPYQVWLDIAGARGRPHHYALLGLTPFEGDAKKVASATSRRISHVESIEAGQREELRQQLLLEIQQASSILTDPALKREYDERLRRRLSANAAKANLSPPKAAGNPQVPHSTAAAATVDLLPPTVDTAAAPKLPHTGVSADPMAPFNPSSLTAGSGNGQPLPVAGSMLTAAPTNSAGLIAEPRTLVEPRADVSDQLARARLSARQLARRRSRAQSWLIAIFLMLLTATVGALGFGYATGWIRFGNSTVNDIAADARRTQALGEDAVSKQQFSSYGSHSGKGDPATSSEEAATEKHTSGTQKVPKNLDSKSPPQPQVERSAVSKTDNAATRMNTAGAESQSQSKSADPPADPAHMAKLRTELAIVRTALGERKFDDAKDRLESAKKRAVSAEETRLFAGMLLISAHVDEFWSAVREGLKSVEKSGELVVGSTPVSIVEVNDKQLVIRINGENRRYPVERLPSGLAAAIAKKWFDERPENKVVLGSFYFVDPLADVAQAKRLWQEAAASGLDASSLLALMPIAETRGEGGSENHN